MAISRGSHVPSAGKVSSSAPALPTCSRRGLSFWFSSSEPGPASGDVTIGWLAPSELAGALSSAVGASFNSGAGLGASEASHRVCGIPDFVVDFRSLCDIVPNC